MINTYREKHQSSTAVLCCWRSLTVQLLLIPGAGVYETKGHHTIPAVGSVSDCLCLRFWVVDRFQ